jgi:pyrroloquinoline quinone biosynthesis protein B
MLVKVLGTAQDAGIPHPNCFCKNCLRAQGNPKHIRLATSLSIHFREENKWYLIDPSPDFKEQLALVQRDTNWQKMMDGIFLTHAHIGHYTGLMFLGKEAISTKKLPVMAGEKMCHFLSRHYPWKQLLDFENITLQEMGDGQGFPLPEGASIIPLTVPHRNEFSETFGFILQGSKKRLLYIPDIDRWDDWDVNLNDVLQHMDYLLIDGTFYSEKELENIGRSYKEIPHPPMTRSMEFLQGYKEKTKIYFTHFNHSNPVIDVDENYRDKVEAEGFYVLDEGETFEL